ncbi:uncharacterized protein LOC103570287 isoform X2 [Microplitis demolitor]|nr:uncharacterized protein LOC103570287 isoform X2 [Microplitis demolitor]
MIDETNLNNDGYCAGDCSALDTNSTKHHDANLSHPNNCFGSIRKCWLEKGSNERAQAYIDYKKMEARHIMVHPLGGTYLIDRAALQPYKYKYEHTGGTCGCLCERTYNPDFYTPRGELLDSFCFDASHVDFGFVATGVRFKRYNNIIHLEHQQGKLKHGKIDAKTVTWKISNHCTFSRKVIDDFDGFRYRALEIVLEDMILDSDAVVTGVTFTKSLVGHHIENDGDISTSRYKEIKFSQCQKNRTIDLVHSARFLLPSTSLLGQNKQLSESCKHHILFGGTSWNIAQIQHVVPFVDLQEIVTNPPSPIKGIGWYYRGQPGYGGFLALKIFTNL